MHEKDYIQMFSEIHHVKPYSADAEIVKTDKGFDLFSIDGFSENEDFFRQTPPELIGHNMAVAACSDLLACGVKPELLLQAWNIDDTKSSEYYRKIALGIETVLKYYGAQCIGGDIGKAKPWNWTATVKAHAAKPITRIATQRIPFDLYVTGMLGDANLAAFQNKPMPKFELRDPAPKDTLFATDTSGGFFDALENFRRVNPKLTLNLDKIPVVETPFTREFALIGGVGEYELVYAVPHGAQTVGIKVGEGDFSGKGISFATGGTMKNPPPDYRNIPPEQWLSATENYYNEVFS